MEIFNDSFIISALLHDVDRFKRRVETCHQLENLPQIAYENLPDVPENQKEIIKQACLLADGRENEGEEREETSHLIPLMSIFSKINPSKVEFEGKISPQYYKPEKIPSINKGIPNPMFDVPEPEVEKYYLRLWQDFVHELNDQIATAFHPDNLLLILEKHTSLIPSDSTNQDVSLFDHLKTAAAIASCLYLYHLHRSPKSQTIGVGDVSSKEFLLVGGDFSGVQGFVYTITTKGALRTLRARSFFLELFAEHVIYEILKPFGLSRANVISTGGGRFDLLLPNTIAAKNMLCDVRSRVNNYLMREHDAKLSIILEWQEFPREAFLNTEDGRNKLVGLWSGLRRKIETAKSRKFEDCLSSLLPPKIPKIVQSQEKIDKGEKCLRCGKQDGEGKRVTIEGYDVLGCDLCLPSNNEKNKINECQICHKETLRVKLPVQGKPLYVCALCDSLYRLGEHLHEARYIIRKETLNEQHKSWVRIENAYYVLTDKEEKIVGNGDPVWIINQWTIPKEAHNQPTYPFFFGYSRYAREEGGERISYDFVDYAYSSVGVKKIGALRMDVDSLGKVFSHRLEDESLIRIAVLSKQLNLFFKYYLNSICNEKKVAIIYSGGDDLFIAGAWSDIVDVAFDINNQFQEFTSDRLTLSGGFVVLPHNFPHYQTARLAGQAEKQSKMNKDKGREKDSLTFFYSPYLEVKREEKNQANLTFKWEDAEGEVRALKDQMMAFLTDGNPNQPRLKVSRSFIYNLLTITDYWRRDGKLYLPKLAWVIKRAEVGLKRSLRDEWDGKRWHELKRKLMDFHTIKSLYPALIWIELLTRKGNKDNG